MYSRTNTEESCLALQKRIHVYSTSMIPGVFLMVKEMKDGTEEENEKQQDLHGMTFVICPEVGNDW